MTNLEETFRNELEATVNGFALLEERDNPEVFFDNRVEALISAVREIVPPKMYPNMGTGESQDATRKPVKSEEGR